jgi:ankyrin repeat protein
MSEWNADDLSTYSDFGHPGVAQSAINLIKNGANPNVKDEDELQATPLIKTSITMDEYSLSVAKVLLEYGADINETNKYGDTALTEIMHHHHPQHYNYKQQLERAQFLLDHGAKIEIDFNGTPISSLLLPIHRNSKEMVALLIKGGADTTFKNAEGQTLKEIALSLGFEEIAALL